VLAALAAAPGLAAPPPPETDAYVQTSARRLCAAKWPENFALQGGCKRNMEDGARSIAELRRRYAAVPAMQRALTRCVAKYTEAGATNFSLAGGCARNQEDGYREMSR